ncbi:MAG: DUF4350 domain-containing protein, partial [Rhodothermaceae bacterium]|nr:DUF4350 domain-containing protein [Rhodothermaceae bacterium]
MRKNVPLLLLGGLVVVFVIVLALQPQPLDWRPTLERDSARPFGAEVFYTLLPEWIGAEVEPIEAPPFVFLGDSSQTGTTYVFLATDFGPDDAEAGRLLRYAERGNTVFVAAETISGMLADSLGVPPDTAEAHEMAPGLWTEIRFTLENDSLLHLANPAMARPEGYRFPFSVVSWALDGVDPSRSTVLSMDEDSVATMARIDVGEGAVILSSTPLAFTNVALTGEGDGADYVAGVLGYLPSQPVYWDAYYKPFREAAQTPLRVVLRAPALTWAYGLILLGVVLFLLFRGRRWQRPVPVVAPPPNAQVGFVETVGRLYYQHADHRGLLRR